MTRPQPQEDVRGEALPAAILFVGVLLTVLIGVHVVLIALARTAVQSAADAAVTAAQAAGPGKCDGDPTAPETARECEGRRGAEAAMRASGSSITETQTPGIFVQAERGVVTAVVRGGIISPVLGSLELTAQSCGPLDDVPPLELTGTGVWQC